MGFSGGCRVSVLLLLSWSSSCILMAVAGADYAKYKNPKQPLNKRIGDLLARMTLAEKIGQMSQIERENATAGVVREYFIGSVLSGGGSVPSTNATPEAWVGMVNEMQRGALSTRLGIPMLYGIDAVHGHGNAYKATIFPHNVGLGCTRDPELAKKIGAATAVEVRATGIPYVFAPCVAVCRDPRWGRCYESFSEDPKVVQLMASVISGLQGEIPTGSRRGAPFVAGGGKRNVAACSKHYVGDGGTAGGANEGDTAATFHELLSVHMPPYYTAVAQGVSTVMVSFSGWNGAKMHANRFLITDFLKTTLRFRGFVISDWGGIERITTPKGADYMLSVKLSIMAGIDMIMIPYTYTEFIDDLSTLVKNGTIPMSRIDDAVRRILRVKFTMGLFENPYADNSLAGELGKQEHRDLAREAVRKSLVLLKNGKPGEKPLLPLPKNAGTILVAGSHAHNLGYQCGGWTITWQGVGGNNLTTGTTILEGIKRAVGHGTEVVYTENADAGFMRQNEARFDYAVVVVGEPPYAQSFGDNHNLTIPAPGPSVIRDVCGSVRCAVVLVSGRPLVVEPYMGAIDALVAAWLPGTEGQGVSDVLFGDYGFTGKLARTWFRSVEQLPMNVGDARYDPLFPFGFGLQTRAYGR
ncbi:beta-glucosidase BoGH3B-like [Lolium rigidum]|uniref:beta-glucosidase BoGH3B-like n=1 Tax=Lolium rigidum TaxID=89674 RepID=UPI001F5DE19B|nr:beta-glucosidase BoGH3B-like [Lolium rigidum]